MAKQRRESIEMFDKGGRAELAEAERAELAVIEGFLPAQMDEAEARAAIDALVVELGATSVTDMGRVMAALKERYAGQMDMSRASGLVKAALGWCGGRRAPLPSPTPPLTGGGVEADIPPPLGTTAQP